jgi:hypothetical protein
MSLQRVAFQRAHIKSVLQNLIAGIGLNALLGTDLRGSDDRPLGRSPGSWRLKRVRVRLHFPWSQSRR